MIEHRHIVAIASQAGRAVRRLRRRHAGLHRCSRRRPRRLPCRRQLPQGRRGVPRRRRSSRPPRRRRAVSARLEAALVAGLTGVGLESGRGGRLVLSYRLATYWLPVLPGWIASTCSSDATSSRRAPGAAAHPRRQAFATEAERPSREDAAEQPKSGAANDVEWKMDARRRRERGQPRWQSQTPPVASVAAALARARPPTRTRPAACPEAYPSPPTFARTCTSAEERARPSV